MTHPIIPGAEPYSASGDARGALVLHGFTGNPQSIRGLALALADAGFTVEMPLLPGHGTDVADMVPTRWKDWCKGAVDAFTELSARCDAVAVVGLSMGGSLAVWLAEHHPDVAALSLVNPLVTPPDTATTDFIEAMVEGGDAVAPGIGSDIAMEGSVESAYPELPLQAALSLFEGVAEVEGLLGSVTCPVLLFTSKQDHVVDPKSSELLVAQVKGPVEQVVLERSYHVATLDYDRDEIEARTVEFLSGALPAPGKVSGPDKEGAPSALSREDVVHVARLARLDLTDEEVELFTAQLRTVLDHATDVASLDLSHLAPSSHPIALENVLRPDEPRPSLDRDEVLAMAPDVEDHRFRVPADRRRGAMTTSAWTVAADVRSGSRSAREVADAALATVAAENGRFNAFLEVLDDEARAQADAVDALVAQGRDPGPLAGVPVALKDNLCTRGHATTCGSRILEGWRPPYDATVVARLRQAGAVALGKTNMDEFAMGSSTENSAFGPTRNPRCVEKVPGGSSGGSAAAVAAGFAPLALGSDTGGSIRQPAALCGVVGMKPTYGRVSRYGLVAFASSLDQIGPFATTVQDAALLFDVIAGHDPLDSTSLPSAPEATLPGLDQGVEGIRVGLCRDLVDGCAADVAARVHEAADALAQAGAKVEEVTVPEFAYGLSAYYLIAPAEASSNLARYDGVRYGLRVDGDDVEAMNTATRTAGFGAEVKRRIMLGTYALSAGYYDAYYAQAQRVRTLVMQAFDRAYASYDVLLGATAPTTAFDLGSKVDDPMAMYMNDVCTIPSNLSGHPAISVPFGTGEDGLPVGVQVLAPALGEAMMFRVAQVVEAHAP